MKISLFHKNKTTTVAAGAARWQAGPAYVRGTKYDVRFRKVPALAREFGGEGQGKRIRQCVCLCTTYDVGCTIY